MDLPSEVVENELTFLCSLNNPAEAERIRLFTNKSLETVSLQIQIVHQNDLTSTTWNFYVREDLKPEKIQLPSSDLAYSAL